MARGLFIEGRRDGYTPDQCYETWTVSRLIEALQSVLKYEGDMPVYLNNDNGYTYGSIDDCSLEIEEYESENDEEDEEEYDDEEEEDEDDAMD